MTDYELADKFVEPAVVKHMEGERLKQVAKVADLIREARADERRKVVEEVLAFNCTGCGDHETYEPILQDGWHINKKHGAHVICSNMRIRKLIPPSEGGYPRRIGSRICQTEAEEMDASLPHERS